MTAAERFRVLGRESLLPGAAAGLIGGVPFGLALIELGALPSIASLVTTDSEIVGVLWQLVVVAVLGAVLGFLLRGHWSAGDTVLWGVAYACFFWFLGPLTLQPLILGEVPAWDIGAAQAGFPSLLGHIVWGATAAVALVVIRSWLASRLESPDGTTRTREPMRRAGWRRGVIIRGLVAGLVGFVAISSIPVGQERMLSPWAEVGQVGPAWLGPLVVALIWGVVFALLHPTSTPTAGASIVRGAGFGFVLWVVIGLTLLPVLRGNGLAWSIPDTRAAFPAFIGSLLFGLALGLVYHWLTRLSPMLLSDEDPDTPPDGGSWGLRAVIRGAAAGLIGGLIFTIVMLQIGFLPIVASLVGSDSEFVGLMVHLLIAVTIGATYGVFFRRQAFDAGAAVGWGVSYGFVWWVLGSLTLAPVILGAVPAWSVEAAASAFPGLIGHLAYGASLGLTFYVLESRYTPWWVSRTEREAALMSGRRAIADSAGPALWASLVLVAILLPTVLAAPLDDAPSGPYSIVAATAESPWTLPLPSR